MAEGGLLNQKGGGRLTVRKDELLDVVGAIKQIIAFVVGLVCGLVPLLGSTGIIM
jgi:hypothetical protein